MSTKHVGWMIGVAALGMMLGLIGKEVAELPSWGAVANPAFVGDMFMHASVVIAAFVGGKLIPTGDEK